MKLSQVLIAVLVTTCLTAPAQENPKTKKDKKAKTEKTSKSKTKNGASAEKPTIAVEKTDHVCAACGRG